MSLCHCGRCVQAHRSREPVEGPKAKVYKVTVEVTVESDEPYSDLELEKDVTDAIGELINVACAGRCDAIEAREPLSFAEMAVTTGSRA